ncbi:MAG TPA: hypothetical protein VKM54_05745, partial [Myxococcota bacterium]|nr:hypothetical protein [Myxococcota bacterium]
MILIHTSEERDPLAWAVDAYFTAARRAQNAVIPYLSIGLKKSIPSSLAKVAGKIAKGETVTDPELDQLVVEYWQASGSRVKDYRNLAEHHAIISSDVRIVPSVTGEPLLVLFLPNNPESKNARDLRFSDPMVHAVPFVIATFVDLLAFVSRVCDAMIAKLGGTTRRWRVMSWNFRGGLSIGTGAVLYGHPV